MWILNFKILLNRRNCQLAVSEMCHVSILKWPIIKLSVNYLKIPLFNINFIFENFMKETIESKQNEI